MKLEYYISIHGMVDYYDIHTGNLYHLADAIDEGDHWVVKVSNGGHLIGTCKVEK